jgi:hypothetical protein
MTESDKKPLNELLDLEPLSGHAERTRGTGLTAADLFCLVHDALPVRGGRTRPSTEEKNIPDRR